MLFSPTPETRAAYIREWLFRIDANKDRALSPQELKDALTDLRLASPGWRAQWAVGVADTNHNGLIDLNDEVEMKEIMKHANKEWGELIQKVP